MTFPSGPKDSTAGTKRGKGRIFYRKGTKTENIKLLIYKDIKKDSANTAFGRFALKLNYLNKQ